MTSAVPDMAPDQPEGGPPGGPPAPPLWAEVALGQVLPQQSHRVTRATLVRYAGASGDFNVIHWSSRIAQSVGLPDVIAHGMLTLALAGRIVTDWVGDPGRVVELTGRMTAPVVVPDDDLGVILDVSAEVTEKRADRLVRVAIQARVGDLRVLGRADAVLRLG